MSFLKEIQPKSFAEKVYENESMDEIMKKLKENPSEEEATSRCIAVCRSWRITFEEWRSQCKLALNAKLEKLC